MSEDAPSSQEHLASQLLRLATLQLVTRSAAFSHIRTFPLHTLSDLLRDYVQLLGTAAKDTAETAGRTKASIWDVGQALEEFGTGSLSDLREELDESDDPLMASQKIRDMAKGLQGYLSTSYREPIRHLTFDGLAAQEESYLAAATLDHISSSPMSSDDDESITMLSSLASSVSALAQIKDEAGIGTSVFDEYPVMDSIMVVPNRGGEVDIKDDGGSSEDDRQQIVQRCSWRDPRLIPEHVLDFLPPFPGSERESGFPTFVRRTKEREREHEQDSVLEEGFNQRVETNEGLYSTSTSSADPWLTPVSYSVSAMGSASNSTHPPAMPQRNKNRKGSQRKRSLSPPLTNSSLPFYIHTTPDIPHAPMYLRPNAKRRIAASSIALSASFSISLDSWFGGIPMPVVRSAVLTPGFLPDLAPSRIHPFNTALPHTIATPVPPHPSPNGALLAPPPHPRLPNTIPSVTAVLGQPSSPHLQLFSRLTRSGPPGPLGPNGEALEYEYVGSTALLASNVDWALRPARMSIRERKDDSGHANTGIKLSLKINRDGSASAQGSPAPTPSYSNIGTPAPNAQGFGGPEDAPPGGLYHGGTVAFSPSEINVTEEQRQAFQINGSVSLPPAGFHPEGKLDQQRRVSPQLSRSATREMSADRFLPNSVINLDCLPNLPSM